MKAFHIKYARHRIVLLALASLSSFVSATWTAGAFLPRNPISADAVFFIGNKCWTLQGAYRDLHDYAPPIIALSYGLLSIVFILKVILEWRLEIHIPLLAERICFTLAYCSQIVVVILGAMSAPDKSACSMRWEDDPWSRTYAEYAEIGQSFCSNWKATFSTSIISLVARKSLLFVDVLHLTNQCVVVTLYTIFPAVPYIWDTARFVVLPKRLRERDTPCDSEEPLLPEYSAHPTEVIEIQELAGQENQMLVQKDGYTILPKEDPDLERGDVNNAK
ncbi:unnamed protein product [Rhizoctonia solani]|uniref:Integral membrane protein n=1 Tax=Rhizoctonia solani TaxID=456999 RepID=A0A8H3E7Z6_9AGAM|nr:unnamed protein product [Rhizoctonia solani]